MGELNNILANMGLTGNVGVFAASVIAVGTALGFVSVLVMLLVWAERRVAGRMQARLGPNRVGPYGLFQSIADGVKLFLKEDIVPTDADHFWYKFAPFLVLMGAIMPIIVVPLGSSLYISSMDPAIYFFMSFATMEVMGLLMAGWGSSSKWSLYGAIRLATQMVSYELPLGLSILTIVIFTGSLSFHDVVAAQGWSPLGWYFFNSPFTFIAGIIFFTAGLAEAKRLPFDLPEAESELVAGFHTEYTGIRFAYFFLAEYCAMFVLSAATAALFLGGWSVPEPLEGVPGLGPLVFAVKWMALLFVMLWLRWTFPRIRLDQVMYLCLKVLLPFALLCVAGAAVWLILRETAINKTLMNIVAWIITIPVFAHAVKIVWKGK